MTDLDAVQKYRKTLPEGTKRYALLSRHQEKSSRHGFDRTELRSSTRHFAVARRHMASHILHGYAIICVDLQIGTIVGSGFFLEEELIR